MKSKIILAVVISGMITGFLSSCSSNKSIVSDLVEAPTKDEETIMASATDAYNRGLFSRSREEWESLRDGYPASYFVSLAMMKIADCYYASGDFPEAVSAYQDFLRLYPGHEAAGYSQFRLGESYFGQYNGIKKEQRPLKEAMKAYQVVIDKYSRSDYASQAREKIANIKSLLSDYDRYVAAFYEKQGELKAAKSRRDSAVR